MTALSPEPKRIALVRQRRYLVENVTPLPSRNEAMLVDQSCLDDDAQGEPLPKRRRQVDPLRGFGSLARAGLLGSKRPDGRA